MSLRIVATMVACAGIVSVASGSGLKDFLKGVKDKAVETVQQQVPDKPEQPAAEEVVPAEAAQAVEAVKQAQPVEQPAQPVQQTAPAATTTKPSTPAKKAASAQAVASSSGVTALDGKGVEPGLAEDPAIVAKQQAQYATYCDEKIKAYHAQDCKCMVDKYPEARTMLVSYEVRRARKQFELACPDGGECDEPAGALWRWMSNPTTQKNWPNAEGQPPKMPRGYSPVVGQPASQQIMSLTEKMCPGASEQYAAREEQECLNNVKSGLIKLQPGESTKAYCACYKEKLIAGEGQSQSMSACRKY